MHRSGHKSHQPAFSLYLYGWDTPSLDTDTLARVEREIESRAREAVVLSTCQRLEVYSDRPLTLHAQSVAAGSEALRHAAAVAAGLESLVLGEREICDQVRAALRAGPPEIRRALQPAMHAARLLRRERAFEGDSGQLLDIALGLADEGAGGRLLVVGPGKAGRLVAARATALGFEVYVSGRRGPPETPESRFVQLSRLAEAPEVEILVVCLGRQAPELTADDLPPVSRLLIDLSTPRKVRARPSTRVVDIAALLAADKTNADLRPQLRQRLDEMLDAELRRQDDRASPMVSVRAEVERLRRREVERTLRLHPSLPADTLDVVTRSLVNQIFDRPMRAMKRTSDLAFHRRVAALWLETPGR